MKLVIGKVWKPITYIKIEPNKMFVSGDGRFKSILVH